MFSHEAPEPRVRHLFDWFDEDDRDHRILPMSGLAPLTNRHGGSFRMELTAFDMECMSAQMGLRTLLPTHKGLLLRVFEAVSTAKVDNFIKYIVRTPDLAASPAVLAELHKRKDEEFQRYRDGGFADDFEWEPTRQSGVVYFDFLHLGPLPILEVLLASGPSAIREKLTNSGDWAMVEPQLVHIRSIPQCPDALRTIVDQCIRFINEPPPPPPPPSKSCAMCGAEGKLLHCSACKAVLYCGKAHQRAHWGSHKLTCARKKNGNTKTKQKDETPMKTKKQSRPPAPTGEGREEIAGAIEANDVTELKVLLARFHPDTQLEFGTGLHIAVLQERREMVQVLLDEGANVNLRGQMGDTPLILAVMYGYTELVELLLGAGADVNMGDMYGNSLMTILDRKFMGSDENKAIITKLVQKIA